MIFSKPLLGTFLLCGALLLPGTHEAHAAGSDSFQLELTAAVADTCQITSTGPYALSFLLDPALNDEVTENNSEVQFWCTKGISVSVSDDGGLRGTHEMTGPDPLPLPYSLSYSLSQAAGGGPSQSITLTVTGTVLYTAFSDKQAGTYTDRVTVTISP